MAKKKAYLVEFAPMTRVIVEDTGNEEDMENKAVEKAAEWIRLHPGDYIYGDNLMEVREDTECPYGSLKWDKED